MRLKRRALLRAMFDRNREDVGTLVRGSVRMLYRFAGDSELDPGSPVQVAFAAPRGTSGVSRTAIRRRLRESFRLVCSDLTDALRKTSRHLTVVLIGRSASRDVQREVNYLVGEMTRMVLSHERPPQPTH